MKKLMILASIVAALALAACGGGDDDDDSGDAAPAAEADANTATEAGGDTVAVEELGDAGAVLVDAQGQALYTADQEADGKVRCVDGCASDWAPLTITDGQPQGSVPGELGVVQRPDGTRQVTYDGAPLYTFTQEGPGEVTGDGFADAFDGVEFTWSVVTDGGGADAPADDAPAEEEPAEGDGPSFGY
jgi:predicted lipoprotein with Yx(FWY)xxD motif